MNQFTQQNAPPRAVHFEAILNYFIGEWHRYDKRRCDVRGLAKINPMPKSNATGNQTR
jgi:hypothetical protein